MTLRSLPALLLLLDSTSASEGDKCALTGMDPKVVSYSPAMGMPHSCDWPTKSLTGLRKCDAPAVLFSRSRDT